MVSLFDSLEFSHGSSLRNRIALAPLTNQQSNDDGTLSDDEFAWLVARARGGFGLTMTCASHVMKTGQAFEGQLGVWSDEHLPGLTRLASAIREAGSVSSLQLQHGGVRTIADLADAQPVSPSPNEKQGSRGLTLAEVHEVRDSFISAARRAQQAGFDGVEVHGAHSYLIREFLSPTANQRTDAYGGDLAGRSRLLHEINHGIREACGDDFTIGVRLSPERFSLATAEMIELTETLLHDDALDFVDISLWDIKKTPHEEAFASKPLLEWFAPLSRSSVRLSVTGEIWTAADAQKCLDAGADFVSIGRAAVAHHNWPELARDTAFVPHARPLPPQWLRQESVSDTFIEYLRNWEGFVA